MEITITFTNSGGKQQTETFSVIRASDLSSEERWALVDQGYTLVTRGDWDDTDMMRVEKMAAIQCGIERGDKFLVKF